MSDFPDVLLTAIAAADRDGVVDALRGRSEAERKRAAAVLVPPYDHWEPYVHFAETTHRVPVKPDHPRERLVSLALIGTATLTQLRSLWGVTWVDERAAAAVLLDRRPRWLGSFARWALDQDQPLWALVRDLVRAGAIARPEAYIPALLRLRWWRDPTGLPALLDHDPEFWKRDAWDLIAYRGEDESQRAADVCGWSAFVAARAPNRDRLLDALLEPLLDLDAYRAAWYTKVWKLTKPTKAERAARAEALRALLGSPAEPIVGFALDELVRAGVPIAAADLTPALAATSKKTVRTALKLLDGDPSAATIALAHPDAEIQSAALDHLEAAVLDDAARAELLRHLDGLAATQRPRAEALTGVALPETDEVVHVDVSQIPAAIRAALNFGGPLPDAPIPGEAVLGEPLEPIADLHELLPELRRLRGEWDAGPSDRELDAILRFCGEPFPDADRYAPDRGGWETTLQRVAWAWARREVPPPPDHPSLVSRPELEARAARGAARPYLALPTHRGGWIDPRVLVARLHEHAGEDELARAILRLAPEGRAEALAAAPDDLPPALRCALGGEPVDGDGPAAVAARAVAGLDPLVVDVRWGPDEWESESFHVQVAPLPPSGPLRRHVEEACGEHSVYGRVALDPDAFPGRRDLACAAAIREIGRNLGEAGSEGLGAAVLETLLPSTEPLPPLSIRLAVLALGSIVERERLLGADLLIAGIEDGRIDRLSADDVALLKPNRLAKGLEGVAAAGPLHRALVRAFLDAAEPSAAQLLVLFDELCAQTSTGPVAAREHLATLSGSSKAAKAARSLLAREGNEDVEPLVLAARVRRARRWREP